MLHSKVFPEVIWCSVVWVRNSTIQHGYSNSQKFTSMYPMTASHRIWGVHVAYPANTTRLGTLSRTTTHQSTAFQIGRNTICGVWTVSTKYMYYALSLSLFTFLPSLLSLLLSKFDILEQLGFEGYAIMVNTGELQTHLLATSKGKNYHKMKQQSGKPLENPFIGYVFSEESGTMTC